MLVIIALSKGGIHLNTNIKFIANTSLSEEPGLYLLSDKANDYHYLGVASNLRARIANHRSKLIQRKHPNDTLQSIFLTSTIDVQILTVVPNATKQQLKEIEMLFVEAAPVLFKNGLINKYKKVTSPERFWLENAN